MELRPGSRLAHFDVVSRLGSGAMGEVWRATDTHLGRDVAIKVLPPALTADPERLARFEREARLLAALDHPKIASVYGLEEVEGTKLLVMQRVEGEDLAARLARGPLPLDEAWSIARQICEGLEAAHERGIAHRDLKPSNIMVDPEGRAVLLDFGLARSVAPEPPGAEETSAPTLTHGASATGPGVVLGTPAYMSPEQARGRPVDKRTDVWAFGAVLWEMLTGTRLFGGETVSDALAAVLTQPVDLADLPAGLPRTLVRLLERCLERDPRQRLRDIGEARILLQRDPAEADAEGDVEVPRTRRGALALAAAAGASLALAVAWVGFRPSPSPPEPPLRLELLLTEKEALSQSQGAAAVLSPDGRQVVFVAGDKPSLAGTARAEGEDSLRTRLHLKRLGEVGAVALPGSEGASAPFFSPDGQWVAYFAGGKLLRVPLGGGSPKEVAAAPDARGGTWGAASATGRETIVFTPDTVSGLWAVAAAGGEPRRLTMLGPDGRERSHRWPAFLPDGRHVVYTVQRSGETYEDASLALVDVEDGSVTELDVRGAYPRVTPSGHLLWVRNGALQAAAFDLATREVVGPPVRVLDDLLSLTRDQALDDGTAQYSFSMDGKAIYRLGQAPTRLSSPAWFDREGRELFRSRRTGIFGSPRIAPDGNKVAMLDYRGNTEDDVWIWDAEDDSFARLTFHRASTPIWSPDGEEIFFVSNPSGVALTNPTEGTSLDLYAKAADGQGPERPVIAQSLFLQGSSISPDGRTLFAQVWTAATAWDLVTFDLSGPVASPPAPLVVSPRVERFPEVSPDGRWFAYTSDADGVQTVMVRSFPDRGGQWQVGTGFYPRWTRGGREIVFFPSLDRLARVSVDVSSGSPRFGPIETLFSGSFALAQLPYDVTKDGERFVVLLPEEDDARKVEGGAILVTDFFDQLRALAPVPAR